MRLHDVPEKNAARPMGKPATDCAKARRYNFPSVACPPHQLGLRFHNAAYVPRAAINEIQTRPTIAQACLRFSTFFAFCRSASLAPTICSGIRQLNLIKNAPHNRIDNCRYRMKTAVERRNSWENNCSRFEQRDDVARMNQIPRRFPWYEDLFAPFLQENIGRAQEHAVAGTGSDSSQRGH